MNKGIKRIVLLPIFCYCSSFVYAQTGIGTQNPQGALHIDGAKDNVATGIPTAAQVANDVIISKTTGFIGVGVLNPQVKLDMRSVGTENALGLGTTSMTAAAAAAGAVRYDAASPLGTGPAIDVSDNLSWKRVYIAPQKAVVVERKISSLAIAPAGTDIIGWTEVRDMSGSFDPVTGIFTAPRDGTYTFLLTFDFVGDIINDGSRVESQFYNPVTNTVLASVYKTFGQSMTGDTSAGGDGSGSVRNTQAGGSSTVTLTLNAGATVKTKLLHTLRNTSVSLRVTSNSSDPANPDDGFNNLTIIEH
ncbi:hypothetical protein QFZ37_002276 [Chryseobacterium ginsenosidimutans]|uniref:hypothetical protein n=1 Tax=Chryseobacterium ginsenosidimutans TaxID=687846 RepID=UPI002787559F|nr:hypothetical protein [Chryseobacterium ginsenosidimutans]MDQ0593907.1 hypothetical protein [Chryseobacterium ginsenosidimutans]